MYLVQKISIEDYLIIAFPKMWAIFINFKEVCLNYLFCIMCMRQEMSQKSRLVNSKRTQTLGTFKNDSLEGEEVMVRAISFAKNMLISFIKLKIYLLLQTIYITVVLKPI